MNYLLNMQIQVNRAFVLLYKTVKIFKPGVRLPQAGTYVPGSLKLFLCACLYVYVCLRVCVCVCVCVGVGVGVCVCV